MSVENSAIWLTVILLANFILAGATALALYKIRKILVLQFETRGILKATLAEAGTIYRQIEALLGLNKLLKLEKPLPALRGWAGSPDFLLVLCEHFFEAQPNMVVECSSGASTVVLARCAQIIGKGKVISLEHDPQFALQTRQMLRRHGLQDWAKVVDSPLVPIPTLNQRWYSLANLPADVRQIEMLVVDGPPWDTAPLARYPSLPCLKSRLANDCVIFLDDASRRPEREIVRRWLAEDQNLAATELPCEKGCARVSRNTSRSADDESVGHSL